MAFAARLQGSGEEIAQLAILTKHFFERLFHNDIMEFEDQMKARLVVVLSILAVILGWSSQLLVFKYAVSPDVNISWQEKNYVFVLTMIIFGIVTLLEWDMLFPDRRDFVNLTPLPIRVRTVFAAKLASFIAFIGLFSIAMSSLSSIVFTIFLAPWRSNSLLFALRHLFAHLISAFAACFCVFFACLFVNFFLKAVLPSFLYHRVSMLVRFALGAVLIFLLLSFLADPGGLSGVLRSLPRLKDHGSPLVFLIPSMWFTGLYELLLGTADPAFRALSGRAGLALGLSIGAFGLACALSYVKQLGRTLESGKSDGRLRGARGTVADLARRAALWTPEERAVGAFFSQTIRASPKHRTVIVNGLACGAAIVMLSIMANRRNIQALTPGNPFFLAHSILIVLIVLGATRIAADIPAAIESNWIFRATETVERHRYVSGLKATIFLQWLLPLSVLLFLAHARLWEDVGTAALHAAFCLAVAGLGLEVLFYHYRKIPFASTHVPGKLQLQVWGIPYLFGLIALLAGLGGLEHALLGHRRGFWAFFIAAAGLWALLRILNVRFLKTHPLIYDDVPEPALIGLPEEWT